MAEPLTIQFQADTSRATSAMANLSAQVIGNMASIGAAMQGGAANSNGFGAPAASAGSNAVGGLAGIFSGLFRANGGPVEAGRPYTVGEMGRELFIPNQNGRMVPIERGTGGGGQGPIAVAIDVTGATGNAEVQRMVAVGVQAGMAQVQRGIGRNIGAIGRNASLRFS